MIARGTPSEQHNDADAVDISIEELPVGPTWTDAAAVPPLDD
jgi:hypothetical protein